jgi:hypothetical protein
MKPQKKAEPQSDVNDVTLGSSAIFENQILKLGGGVRQNYLRPVAFRLHFSMVLALQCVRDAPLRPQPQGGMGQAS